MTKRRPGLIVGAAVGGLVLIAAVVYLVGYFKAGDKTPANASVNGVNIGSMTEAQAIAKLKTSMDDKATAPIKVAGNGKTVTLKPADVGLTVDYAATVKKAGAGKSWSPTHIWEVLRGGGPITPVLVKDDKAVQTALTKAAPTFAVQSRNASLAWQGTTPTVTPAVNAVALDVPATAKAVEAAWMSSTEVKATLTSTEPDITTAEAQKTADDVAKPLVAAPIVVKAADKQFELTPADLAAATTFAAKDGTIASSTDMNKLWTTAQPKIDKLGFTEGKDATIELVAGAPHITPSTDGKTIGKDDLVKAVQPVLTKAGAARTVTVKVVTKPAKFSTADAQKLQVKEVTGQFTTNFPYAEYRNTNLSRAAASINGTFLKPGEVFSLNNTLGERTAANGYVDGYVIQGNKLKKEPGGGVSQSATTTYNAVFFAGLQVLEHHPHTMYFPRYPAGREATVYYGSLDLRFKNDTPYGVLMQAFVQKASPGTQGSITVRVWSTKVYDKVESSELVKSNYTDGQDLTSDAPDCEYQAPSQGFDVNYQRLFYKNGKVVKTEKYFWRYHPIDQITCTKKG